MRTPCHASMHVICGVVRAMQGGSHGHGHGPSPAAAGGAAQGNSHTMAVAGDVDEGDEGDDSGSDEDGMVWQSPPKAEKRSTRNNDWLSAIKGWQHKHHQEEKVQQEDLSIEQ